MPTLWIDIETYCELDIRRTNVYRYVEHPSFQILMASWSSDGETIHDVIGHDNVLRIPGIADPKVRKVAHNAAFERICFSAALGLPVGVYLDPEHWVDTMALAAEYGLPQGLDNLARALGASPKDSAGTRLINLFCKPNKKGQRNLPEDFPEEWKAFVAYCHQDTGTLIEVGRKLRRWNTPTEKSIYLADQRVNDAGIPLDVQMARTAMQVAEDNRMVDELELQVLTGVSNPGSQPQMLRWFREEAGLDIDNIKKDTLEKLLEGDLQDDVRRVIELRLELALVASKKYSAALSDCSRDGRLRGSFRFFGAHTGRWSGRGAQPQNLPREQLANEDLTDAAILDLNMGLGATPHTLKALVRAMFVGPFTVVDYSSIEARVIAWLAGEQWALDAFAAGRDIYVETANRMGGLTRSQGKVAVLALGYAGGINSLKALGGSNIVDEKMLARASGAEARNGKRLDATDRALQMLVNEWRTANPHTVRFWFELDDAFTDNASAGRLHLRATEPNSSGYQTVRMRLPSGRDISYHGVKWENYRVKDPETGKMISKKGYRYTDPRGQGRIGTYGGRLAENATQAVARDIMAEAIVRLQNRGYTVVAHVHDEIIVEGHHPVSEIATIMTESPSWAYGLPIAAEGFNCRRYRKG